MMASQMEQNEQIKGENSKSAKKYCFKNVLLWHACAEKRVLFCACWSNNFIIPEKLNFWKSSTNYVSEVMKKKVSVADENLFFVVWCWPQMLAAVAVPGPGHGVWPRRGDDICYKVNQFRQFMKNLGFSYNGTGRIHGVYIVPPVYSWFHLERGLILQKYISGSLKYL